MLDRPSPTSHRVDPLTGPAATLASPAPHSAPRSRRCAAFANSGHPGAETSASRCRHVGLPQCCCPPTSETRRCRRLHRLRRKASMHCGSTGHPRESSYRRGPIAAQNIQNAPSSSSRTIRVPFRRASSISGRSSDSGEARHIPHSSGSGPLTISSASAS